MDIALVRSTKEDIGIDDAFARYTELEGDIICPHCLGGIHIKKSNLPLKKQDRYFSHNPNIELICPAKQVNLQYFGATSNSDYHKTQEVFSFIMKNREARKAMVYVLQSIIYGFSYKELDKCAVLARDKGTLGSRNLLYRDLPYVLSTFRTLNQEKTTKGKEYITLDATFYKIHRVAR